MGVSRRTGDGILFIKTETIVGTASSFGGGIIKSSILDKVRNLHDIKWISSRYLEISAYSSERRKFKYVADNYLRQGCPDCGPLANCGP